MALGLVENSEVAVAVNEPPAKKTKPAEKTEKAPAKKVVPETTQNADPNTGSWAQKAKGWFGLRKEPPETPEEAKLREQLVRKAREKERIEEHSRKSLELDKRNRADYKAAREKREKLELAAEKVSSERKRKKLLAEAAKPEVEKIIAEIRHKTKAIYESYWLRRPTLDEIKVAVLAKCDEGAFSPSQPMDSSKNPDGLVIIDEELPISYKNLIYAARKYATMSIGADVEESEKNRINTRKSYPFCVNLDSLSDPDFYPVRHDTCYEGRLEAVAYYLRKAHAMTGLEGETLEWAVASDVTAIVKIVDEMIAAHLKKCSDGETQPTSALAGTSITKNQAIDESLLL